MASEVNGLSRRSAQTRRRIVEAAHGLFATRGYTGTTFQEVADADGVSAPTVSFHYGSTSRLLKHVVDVASVGDDEPFPLLDRPWFTDHLSWPPPCTSGVFEKSKPYCLARRAIRPSKSFRSVQHGQCGCQQQGKQVASTSGWIPSDRVTPSSGRVRGR
ncbi:TetR/AcrR family transcriptional regulator [Streptosporangium roseum]|uniref:TetR/AcrR family transcriptional regulator n=1 Tax=Streptosporangium roseum TaxID=2001 RepID=UPI00331F322C